MVSVADELLFLGLDFAHRVVSHVQLVREMVNVAFKGLDFLNVAVLLAFLLLHVALSTVNIFLEKLDTRVKILVLFRNLAYVVLEPFVVRTGASVVL